MQVTFNGLELGDDSLYVIQQIDGLDSLPDMTIGNTPKPRRNGSWLGGKLSSKRVITIQLAIMGDPDDDYRTTRPKLALQNACQMADYEVPLIFNLDYDDPPVLINASVTSFDLPITANYSRSRTATIEFTATDPKKYAAVVKVQQTPAPIVPPGAPYGQNYGFQYATGTANSGTFTANNAGNTASPTIYTITGPISNPSITVTDHLSTRRTQFNLALASTDSLVIDTAAGTVLLNGADRLGNVNGALIQSLALQPGDSTISFDGVTPTGSAAALSAQWRDSSH